MRPNSAPLSVRPIAVDRFLLGAAYYPEHVDESYWARDADRMVQCGAPGVPASSIGSEGIKWQKRLVSAKSIRKTI